MNDNQRLSDNPGAERLTASDASPGYSETDDVWVEFVSNGFKIGSNNTGINKSGSNYIYAAFAGSNLIEVIDVDVAANTMTVNGGDWLAADTWNQSQEWSSSISLSDPFTKGSLAKLFNGVLTDSCGISASSAAVTGTTLTLSQPITDVTKVEIGCYSPSDDTNYNEYRVNAEPLVSTASLGSGNVITLYDGNPLTLTSIFGQSSTSTTSLEFLWIKVNGRLLVDTSVSGGQTVVTGSTESAEGTIQSVDGTEVDLSASSGRWIADNKAGIPFSFVPSTPIVDTQNEAYGKLQIINDKAQITGIQANDPGFLNVTAKDYSIQFPSVFATGNAPDVDLPVGCSISAIVKAENNAGASVKESNVLLPQTPNPEGSAGPITDVEGGGQDVYSTDTIASVDPSRTVSFLVFDTGRPGDGPFEDNKTLPIGSTISDDLTGGTYNPSVGPVAGAPELVWKTASGIPITNMQISLVSTGQTPGRNVWVSQDGISWTYNQIISGAGTYTVSGTYTYVLFHGGAGNQTTDVPTQVDNSPILTFPTDNNFDNFEVGDVVQTGDWNQSQEWSDNYTSNPTLWDIENLFDGTLSKTYGVASTAFTLTFNPPITGTKFEISDAQASAFDPEYTINGSSVRGTAVSNSPTAFNFTDISSIVDSGTLSSLTYNVLSSSSFTPQINGIRVDGKLLVDTSVPDSNAVSITAIDDSVPSIKVDGGSWYGADGTGDAGDGRFEPSQEWSSSLTSPGPFDLGPEYAFDGIVNSSNECRSDNGDTLTFTPSGGISFSQKVEVYNQSTFNQVILNSDPAVPMGSAATWFTIKEGSGTINAMVFSDTTNNKVAFGAIRVDGKILVDASVPGGQGDTDITKIEAYDSKLTVGTNANLDGFIAADALVMVDDTGAVASYTPQTSEIASVATNTSVYSDYITGKQGLLNPTNAFDGTESTMCQDFDGVFNIPNEYQLTFTPPSPISFTSKVEVYSEGAPGVPYGNIFQIDLGSGLGSPIDSIVNTWVTVATGSGSLHQLVTKADMNACSIGAIRVDGAILTDATTITNEVLTFNTPNPDLQFLSPGDNVGTDSGFTPVIYTGNGGTQSITGVGFMPDLVWIKAQGRLLADSSPCQFDTIRGVSNASIFQ